jgi:hypothetical protein
MVDFLFIAFLMVFSGITYAFLILCQQLMEACNEYH